MQEPERVEEAPTKAPDAPQTSEPASDPPQPAPEVHPAANDPVRRVTIGNDPGADPIDPHLRVEFF